MRYLLYLILVSASFSFLNNPWGFYGHKKITMLAIYSLPEDMMIFYKANALGLMEKSVAPDQRRYVIEEEGPRHFIDLNSYKEIDSIPPFWFKAIEKFGEDTLVERGVVPWHAYFVYRQLIKAFSEKDYPKIISKSSDLSHYLADANVPLHTTSNYNGQETGQEGIHGFWETRLPELFSDNYDFLVGKASYLEDPQRAIWLAILQANELVDSVLIVEKLATIEVGESKKFAFEQRGKRNVRVYSEKFSKAYHIMMPSVELQMRRSVKLIADLWFTAWIEAGQPDLLTLSKPDNYYPDSLDTKRVITPKRAHQH